LNSRNRERKFYLVALRTIIKISKLINTILIIKYTYLLTMQLDSQRQFFEERLNKGEEKAKLHLEEVEQKWSELSAENCKLKESLQQVTKDKTNLDKKYTNVIRKIIFE